MNIMTVNDTSPLAKKIKINDELDTFSVHDLPFDLLANHIFSFVGDKQYRFVGGVCKTFEEAYRTKYPERTTKYNVSSIQHAKFCFDEAYYKPQVRYLARDQPWYYYVRCENLSDADIELLSWTKSTFGCLWRTCVMATMHIDLDRLLRVDTRASTRIDSRETEEVALSNSEEPIFGVTDLPLNLLEKYVLAFVGNNQYRFVGMVCKKFKNAYVKKFPDKTTQYNMSSMKHASICFEEAPAMDKPLLRHLAPYQSWHHYYRMDNMNVDTDLVLVHWAKSNFGCLWKTCVLAAAPDAKICTLAAKHGSLPLLQEVRSIGYSWDENTCAWAAARGKLAMLKWLRSNGCPWAENTCTMAARNGHLEVLQWARSHRCKWDENTCALAAENGHMKILQWARSKGCRWDKGTCASAALKGHFEILKWAHLNGCPWDRATSASAYRIGHSEMFQWVQSHGCPHDDNYGYDYAYNSDCTFRYDYDYEYTYD